MIAVPIVACALFLVSCGAHLIVGQDTAAVAYAILAMFNWMVLRSIIDDRFRRQILRVREAGSSCAKWVKQEEVSQSEAGHSCRHKRSRLLQAVHGEAGGQNSCDKDT